MPSFQEVAAYLGTGGSLPTVHLVNVINARYYLLSI